MDIQFAWDSQKAENNLKKHHVSFELAARVFADPFALTCQDRIMAIRIFFNKFPTPTSRVAFWRYRPSTPTSRKPLGRSGDTSSSLSKTARSELITGLDKDLSLRHGKGFSRSNLVYMRLLYLRYPISQKPSHQLSWSHYVELLKLDDELERSFYEKQAIAERWSVPELKRQKAAALFLRLASGKNKSDILQLAQ